MHPWDLIFRLFGITTLQMYIYFNRNPRDNRWMKGAVSSLHYLFIAIPSYFSFQMISLWHVFIISLPKATSHFSFNCLLFQGIGRCAPKPYLPHYLPLYCSQFYEPSSFVIMPMVSPIVEPHFSASLSLVTFDRSFAVSWYYCSSCLDTVFADDNNTDKQIDMIFGVSTRAFIDAGYYALERFIELIFITPLLFSPHLYSRVWAMLSLLGEYVIQVYSSLTYSLLSEYLLIVYGDVSTGGATFEASLVLRLLRTVGGKMWPVMFIVRCSLQRQ